MRGYWLSTDRDAFAGIMTICGRMYMVEYHYTMYRLPECALLRANVRECGSRIGFTDRVLPAGATLVLQNMCYQPEQHWFHRIMYCVPEQ